MKKIILEFDKTITNLAGNKFGRQVFDSQIRNVEVNETYEIIFPPQIENIATSFIQGFFYEFMDTFGLDGVKNNIDIKSSIEGLKQRVVDCLV